MNVLFVLFAPPAMCLSRACRRAFSRNPRSGSSSGVFLKGLMWTCFVLCYSITRLLSRMCRNNATLQHTTAHTTRTIHFTIHTTHATARVTTFAAGASSFAKRVAPHSPRRRTWPNLECVCSWLVFFFVNCLPGQNQDASGARFSGPENLRTDRVQTSTKDPQRGSGSSISLSCMGTGPASAASVCCLLHTRGEGECSRSTHVGRKTRWGAACDRLS